MPPTIATLVCVTGILGLFWLDRERNLRTSIALWIPVVWVWIVGSRPVSAWLNLTPADTSPAQYMEGSPIDRAVFSIILGAGFLVLCGRGRRVLRLLVANWPVLLFVAYCAFSTLWSDYPGVAFKRWIKSLGDVVMVLIILTDPEPLTALKRFFNRAGLVLLPISVLLIKYYPALGWVYDPWSWANIHTGVTTSKNTLGGVAMIFGIAALWRLLDTYNARRLPQRNRHFIAQGTLLVTALWLLWQANSATATSCFVMGSLLLVTVMVFRGMRKPAIVHAMVGTVLCLSVFALFLAPESGFVESVGRNSTLSGRTELWKIVLSMPVNRIVGTGFESFWLGSRVEHMWSLYWWHPNQSHNGYIEVLLNLGWIGIMLLGLILITAYRNISGSVDAHVSTAAIELVYFVIAVLNNFTEAGFKMLGLGWLTLLLVTVASAAPRIFDRRTEVAASRNNRSLGSRPHFLPDHRTDPCHASF